MDNAVPEWLRRLGVTLLIVILLALGFRSVLSARPATRTELVVWGLASGEETKGLDAQIQEFERRHPNVEVRNLSMGAGGMNNQKLLTSIAGNAPPDLVQQDRFTIGDWAARETFIPLDDLLADPHTNGPDNPWRIVPADYYPACWKEALYKGKLYAIPNSTDDRLLYWNKDLFRKAGLNPEQPPRTWEELVTVTKALTKQTPDGTFQQIGFIPVVPSFSNSWFYLYSWQNGGEFMSPDGRRCTMLNPESEGALQWLSDFYGRMNGAEKVMSFASTFQPREQDPFITGKMAMKIDTNDAIRNLARFGPNLDFGVAPAPVPAARLRGEGRFKGVPKYITWSGGFSFAIPVGSRHVPEAWAFIQWMNSLESRRIFNRVQREWNLSQNPPRPYVPVMHANRKMNDVLYREFAPEGDSPLAKRLRAGMQVGLNMMPMARFRPVTFVGQRLWDEHIRAFEEATRHRATVSPAQALVKSQAAVQSELDLVYGREQKPLLPIGPTVAVCAAVVLALLAGFIFYCTRQGRVPPLLRSEARAGYLFVAPWLFGFAVLFLGPMLASIVFSLCDYDVLHPPRWVGMQNYARMLADPILKTSFYNILFLAGLGIPLSIGVSLGLALLLNSKVKGMPAYRTMFYLPSLTPVVAMAVLWLFILNPDSGVVNQAWRATLTPWFGWAAPTWLAGEEWSKPALILMSLWGAGGGIILWLAGLSGVPQHLYEAADLDGAGWWHRFQHVTLPMLTPYILFNLIMGTIGWLQRFTDIYVMTNGAGGPVDSTMVPVLYLFRNAFEYFKMGYASAWAWLMFLVVMLLTAFNLLASKRWVYYEGERK
jgi:ABC-type sugar transport system permease subunit/ABC-type glycerol-3-phosphate transport system substrate-binding protein